MSYNIEYVKGDVTAADGPFYLLQCCNNIGAMGAGVARAIMRRWPKVYTAYTEWGKHDVFTHSATMQLGSFQVVEVEFDKRIVNLIGQDQVGKDKLGNPPIRYFSLGLALHNFAAWYNSRGKQVPVIMPQIGAGLAGGHWSSIEHLVYETLVLKGIPVKVYIYD